MVDTKYEVMIFLFEPTQTTPWFMMKNKKIPSFNRTNFNFSVKDTRYFFI